MRVVAAVALVAILVAAVAAKPQMRATPFGMRPAECVMEVPEGALVEASGAGVRVSALDGSFASYELVTPDVCHTDNIVARALARRRSVGSANAIADGWLDYAGWYPPKPAESSISFFSSNVTIPSAPVAGEHAQTLYAFIGSQNNNENAPVNILQPVLTYEPEYHGKFSAASWACCPGNITTHSAELVGFTTGDQMYGYIKRLSPDTWTIYTAVGDHSVTLTVRVGSYDYDWADVTYEVYTVAGCKQLFASPIEFTELLLLDKDGTNIIDQATWTLTPPTACGGSIAFPTPTTAVITHTGSTEL